MRVLPKKCQGLPDNISTFSWNISYEVLVLLTRNDINYFHLLPYSDVNYLPWPSRTSHPLLEYTRHFSFQCHGMLFSHVDCVGEHQTQIHKSPDLLSLEVTFWLDFIFAIT